MTEQELKGFISTVTRYFVSVTGTPATVGFPYIKDVRSRTFDFTGVIGISGSRKGGIYYTAGRGLLKAISASILGEEVEDDDSLYDLVGEMTNTIAGNMREYFGSFFHISVPIVVVGRIDDIVIKLKPPVFVIPIAWKGNESDLAIGLE
jgi:chemotaxis protein CheX